MGILFVGGEDADFVGNIAVVGASANAAHRRTSYSRCAIGVSYTGGNGAGYYASIGSQSAFWMSGRAYLYTADNQYGYLLKVRRGANLKLAVGFSGQNTACKFTLVKIADNGTTTTLATSTLNVPYNDTTQTQKIDLYVSYAVSGNVKLYVNGILYIDYTGDVTTNGYADVDGVAYGAMCATWGGSAHTYWSECVVSTDDTRSLGLATLPVSGAGTTSGWDSGSYADVNETTLADSAISSGAANQVMQFTVTPAAILSAAVNIGAVVVNARGQRGATSGPANLQLSVRTGGSDYFSESVPLATSYGVASRLWGANPATSSAWAASDVTAAGFNIGVKSIA